MAENKKSFLLYADLIHTVKKLPVEKQGELFMTILMYVNDENPLVEDIIIDLVFEPIKQQLKRDLKRWDEFKEKQSANGKLGGRPKNNPTVSICNNDNPNNPSLSEITQKSPNVTVTDNVNVTDIIIVDKSTEQTKPDFEKRQQNFYNSLITSVEIFGKEMVKEFYDYWREPNKSKSRMKFEQEKTWDLNLRLQRWERNNFSKNKTIPDGGSTSESKAYNDNLTKQYLHLKNLKAV